MIIEVNAEHPQPRRIAEALRRLGSGELVAYPTDTVYAVGCSLEDKEAVRKLLAMREGQGSALPPSIIVPDLSAISQWAMVEGGAYRVLRRATPGPFTFILPATRQVPRQMLQKRKSLGVRVPDSPIALALCRALGGVLVTTSAKGEDGELLSSPREIEEAYKGQVAVVLDGGPIAPSPSTVVDLTLDPPEVIRVGKGDLETIGLG